jgi:hypothetical protein
MIISHRRRFVILLPWKSASSTLHGRLGSYSESPYSRFYELNPVLKRVVHQHMTYADFAALPESRLGYRTAAFVRNPYDRVFSGFRQLQKDIETQPQQDFPHPEVRRLVMAQLSENLAALREARFSLDAWVESIDERLISEVGRNSSFPLHPAHYWTHYEGRLAVDFLGRVEDFERDFDRLCQQLGIESPTRDSWNVDAGETELSGDRRGYRYVDRFGPAARRRINQLFEADFELFGYERVD